MENVQLEIIDAGLSNSLEQAEKLAKICNLNESLVAKVKNLEAAKPVQRTEQGVRSSSPINRRVGGRATDQEVSLGKIGEVAAEVQVGTGVDEPDRHRTAPAREIYADVPSEKSLLREKQSGIRGESV
ncbi:hypothetical protein K440DRAFT_637620 [Wilcoxina mikolae CBS 423.85]|nr:hypothetical protein K440DRAFT_637620 [Wilcoxina mikolae CBS 423.85]